MTTLKRLLPRQRQNRKLPHWGTEVVNVLKRHADGFVTVELPNGSRKLAYQSEVRYY